MKKKQNATNWHKLDNTANVFPVVASKSMTNVYRLTSVLNDKIDALLLQQALDIVLPYFKAFCVRLRHGLFWSYFETNLARAVVEKEREAPCRQIDPLVTNRYLFRVLYYENRIHLEIFHALTDGIGGMRFLKAITYAYVKLANPNSFSKEQLAQIHGIEGAANTEDAYVKNYVSKKSKTFKEPRAYRVKGEFRAPDSIGVLTAIMPLQQLKNLCKSNNASISEYLTALFAYGIYKEYMGASGAKKPVNMFIPVDLRRIFNTDTCLNFFSNIVVGITFWGKQFTFEEVLQEVKEKFATQINKDYFEQKLSYTVRSETNLITRIVPLPLKNGILRIIFEHSNHGSTMPFSNLGVQDPLPEFAQFIESYRFLIYACEHDAIKCGAISCNGNVMLNFTTYLEGFKLPHFVVRWLTSNNIDVEIESNGDEDEIL